MQMRSSGEFRQWNQLRNLRTCEMFPSGHPDIPDQRCPRRCGQLQTGFQLNPKMGSNAVVIGGPISISPAPSTIRHLKLASPMIYGL
jgi:hypothetical protein